MSYFYNPHQDNSMLNRPASMSFYNPQITSGRANNHQPQKGGISSIVTIRHGSQKFHHSSQSNSFKHLLTVENKQMQKKQVNNKVPLEASNVKWSENKIFSKLNNVSSAVNFFLNKQSPHHIHNNNSMMANISEKNRKNRKNSLSYTQTNYHQLSKNIHSPKYKSPIMKSIKSKSRQKVRVQKTQTNNSHQQIQCLAKQLTELKTTIQQWCSKKFTVQNQQSKESIEENFQIEKLRLKKKLQKNNRNTQTQQKETEIQKLKDMLIDKQFEISHLQEELRSKQINLTLSIAEKVKIKEKFSKTEKDMNQVYSELTHQKSILKKKDEEIEELKKIIHQYSQPSPHKFNSIEEQNQLQQKISSKCSNSPKYRQIINEVKGYITNNKKDYQEKQFLCRQKILLQREQELKNLYENLKNKQINLNKQYENRMSELSTKQIALSQTIKKQKQQKQELQIFYKNQFQCKILELKQKEQQLLMKQEKNKKQFQQFKQKMKIQDNNLRKKEKEITLQMQQCKKIRQNLFKQFQTWKKQWKIEVELKNQEYHKQTLLLPQNQKLQTKISSNKYILENLNTQIQQKSEQKKKLQKKKMQILLQMSQMDDITNRKKTKKLKNVSQQQSQTIQNIMNKKLQIEKDKLWEKLRICEQQKQDIFQKMQIDLLEIGEKQKSFKEFEIMKNKEISSFVQKLEHQKQEIQSLKKQKQKLTTKVTNIQSYLSEIIEEKNFLQTKLLGSQESIAITIKKKASFDENQKTSRSPLRKSTKKIMEIGQNNEISSNFQKIHHQLDVVRERIVEIVKNAEQYEIMYERIMRIFEGKLQILVSALLKMKSQQEEEGDQEQIRSQNMKKASSDASFILKYLNDSLYLALSHRHEGTMCVEKIISLQNTFNTLNPMIFKHQEEQDEDECLRLNFKDSQCEQAPQKSEIFRKYIQIQNQYDEILQIFSVNADALSMATTELKSQKQITELFNIEENPREQSDGQEKSQSDKIAINIPQMSRQMKRADKIHNQLLKMITNFINEFREMVCKVQSTQQKMQAIQKQYGSVCAINKTLKLQISQQNQQIQPNQPQNLEQEKKMN